MTVNREKGQTRIMILCGKLTRTGLFIPLDLLENNLETKADLMPLLIYWYTCVTDRHRGRDDDDRRRRKKHEVCMDC